MGLGQAARVGGIERAYLGPLGLSSVIRSSLLKVYEPLTEKEIPARLFLFARCAYQRCPAAFKLLKLRLTARLLPE